MAVTGEDDQLTLWDLSLEEDKEDVKMEEQDELQNLPPQLLFIHQVNKSYFRDNRI